MRNKLLGIALMSVAAGLVFVACGEDGPITSTCSGDGDCQTGELCHPLAKVCVTSCNDGNDCPDESKNCAALTTGGTTGADGGVTGGTASGKFCQCSTNALCGSAGDANIICAAEDKICTTKCTDNTQCGPGRTCDQTTGDCLTTAGTGGGGGNGGNCDWATCGTDTWTTSGKTCVSGTCAAGASCSGAGKSTCGNNEACYSSACGVPPRPVAGNTGSIVTCNNFYSGSHSGGPTWNPGTSTGPVIYQVTELRHGNAGTAPYTHCASGTEYNVQVRAYRTDADWPATRAQFEASPITLFYVTTAGADRDVMATPTALLPSVGYNPNGRDIDFQMYFCLTNADVNAFQPGFYFSGGNEACRQL